MKDILNESYALPKWIEKISTIFTNAFLSFIEKEKDNWRNGTSRTMKYTKFPLYANMIAIEFVLTS